MRISVSTFTPALLLAFGACHDATSPQRGPLSIVAGSGVTDTVLTKLPQALVAEVRGNDGRPLNNVLVRFTSVLGTNTLATARVAPVTGGAFTSIVADSTDNRGMARVLVQLGGTAGAAKIVIDVPELSLQDTARYTVLPGTARIVIISVRDTAIATGAHYSLSAAAADIYGNKRPNDAINFTSRSAVATVDASGNVIAIQEGRGTVLVQSGSIRDSAQLSIVPLHELVIWGAGNKLSTVNTDGTQLQLLTTATDFSLLPQWSSDGSKVLIYEGDPGINAVISTVDMNGARSILTGPNATLSAASYGRFTRDGSWVYFTGTSKTESGYLTYRVRPDGTQLERVGPGATEGGSLRPDISPDGTTEIFQTTGGAIGSMEIATHTIKSLGVTGLFPRFSPDGAQIAYLGGPNAAQLYVMNADGTNPRPLTPLNVTYQELGALDWSPDGRWLIAATYSELDLVRLSDGVRLPLRLPGFQAAWKP